MYSWYVSPVGHTNTVCNIIYDIVHVQSYPYARVGNEALRCPLYLQMETFSLLDNVKRVILKFFMMIVEVI